jgi:hypothetical protein
MSGETCRLARHALHHVAVAAQHVDVMVKEGEAIAIEVLGEPAFGDRHTDGIAAALTERARRGLDAGRHPILGVARRPGAHLAKVLDVVEANRRQASGPAFRIDLLDAGEVDKRVEKHGGVPDREHKTVSIGPVRHVGIDPEELRPQRVAHRRKRHRGAGMAGLRLLDGIHGERTDRVDG